VAVSKWLSNANSRLRFVIPDECHDEPLDFRTILPVRKVKLRGKVADTEHECTLRAESFNEFKALRILVAVGHYDSCKVQPCELRFKFKGLPRRYYPDFLIIRRWQLIAVEVKRDKKANRPEIREYFAFLTILFAEHGFEFVLWRESEIYLEPRYTNVALLLRYRRVHVSDVEREIVRRAFSSTTSMSLIVLSEVTVLNVQSICHLVLEGMLYVDWWAPLGRESLISTVPIGRQLFPSPLPGLE
jgi:hypothetical protein